MSHWLHESEKKIAETERLCAGCARALSLRLSHLLLQRLGQPLGGDLASLLPAREQSLFAGLLLELGPGESSIGYPDFVAHAQVLLPNTEATRLVDAFLAGIYPALPEGLAARTAAVLPLELRSPFLGRPLQHLGEAA
jgi:hypothetical protein